MHFNFLLLDYAIGSLYKRSKKQFFIFGVLSLLIFLLATVLMISEAMKVELMRTLHTLPDITLQRFSAGKQSDIPIQRVDDLLEIEGVRSVTPRVWGYYYFKPAGVNFSVVGLDAYEEPYASVLADVVKAFDFKRLESHESMIVGSGVKKILEAYYYHDFFHFITPSGAWQKIQIAGVFDTKFALQSNDMIILPKKIAYKIFEMDEHLATDITVNVGNKQEVSMIVQKIIEKYPDTRAITQEDLRISYQNIFDYKSGFFLSLFVVCAFAFLIIIYDKSSGLSLQERREIGLLKAVGWSRGDILRVKLYEGVIISLSAYLVGIIGAIFYIYFLQAPVLRNIFMGYSVLKPDFILPFYLDGALLVLLFLLSVPIYAAATLIPLWKTAMLDADEVMR